MTAAKSTTSTAPGTKTEGVLEKLQLTPGHATIVGLQWGDEGKGKVVDMLAAEFDYVARYNGGANAGHTVVVGDQTYKLHLIPSGMLYGDKMNVLGNGVVIDPAQLVKEILGLRERNITVDKSTLAISDRAHVVLPWHPFEDKLLEETSASPIGTTGRGIGPCYADKALRLNAIRMGDLVSETKMRDAITRVVAFKNTTLGALAKAHGKPFTPFDADAIIKTTQEHMAILGPMVADTASMLHKATDAKQTILFEGANATMLDVDHGTYPYVTSSNASALGIGAGSGVPPQCIGRIIGVVKAYCTRVGGGPMPTELFDSTGDAIRERGREYGTTTGRPRRVGWLDLVAVRYAAMISGATELCITLLDVLAGEDVPFLNYFDTPKITQDNMGEFTKPVF